MSRYVAATANLEVIIDVETEAKFIPTAIFGQRTLFVAAGTRRCLRRLRGHQRERDHRLGRRQEGDDQAAATGLAKPNLDHERSYVVSEKRGIIDRVQDFLGSRPQPRAAAQRARREEARRRCAAERDGRASRRRTPSSMLQGMLRIARLHLGHRRVHRAVSAVRDHRQRRAHTSSRTVRGPTLTDSTSMCARKRPVATVAPRARSASTNAGDQRLGDLGGRGGRPARPPPLAGVAVEGELADHEHRGARVGGGALVVEDPQLVHLAGERPAPARRCRCG